LAERPVSTKTKSQAQNTAPGFGEQTARLLHFDATVEGPGLVVAAELGRALLAVADHFEVGGIHALQGEVLLDRVGATLAEGHVVLAGTALVGMAFEADLTVAAAQTLGVDVEGGAGLAGQHRLVELEVEDGGNAAGAEVIAVGGTVASGAGAHAAAGHAVGTGAILGGGAGTGGQKGGQYRYQKAGFQGLKGHCVLLKCQSGAQGSLFV